MVRIVLKDERPLSLNKFWAGVHWSKRKEYADRVHLLVRAAIDPKEISIFTEPVNITITAYFDKRPLDCSNVLGKPYEDALIGWVIENDSPKYVSSFTTKSRIDKENPRLEILIEPI